MSVFQMSEELIAAHELIRELEAKVEMEMARQEMNQWLDGLDEQWRNGAPEELQAL